jgi:hypothetical protein
MARFLTLLHRCALAALIALGPLAAVAQPPKPAYVSGSITTGALTKFAGPQSVTTGNLSGDCTTSGSLAVICLKTNGVNFAYFATGTDASNLTGTVAGARLSGSYTGITGLGTVTAGTWNGTVIGSAYGGAGSVTGILKANGSGTVSAATSGTDYQGPITLTTTGTSGAATFSGGTLNIPQYSGGGGGGGLFNQVLSSTPTATSTGLVASANASVNNIATGAQVLNTGSLGYAHAAPTYSGTYSIKALLGWNDFISQFNGPTICLGDGTNFVCFGYGLGTVGSSNAQVAIQKRVVSGAGLAFSSNISTASNYLPAQNFIWVKVYFDGTSVNFYVSSDGAAWVLVSTQNPAAFASNYNTVAIQSGSGVTGTSVSVLSWTQGVN